ncbi:MAG: sulfite exporter TauE/SafE family protein [Gemmatimonadaceae bacterium]|nr:sulfite exporter TauE/SafE family protein [Gemmatimonadaceae bacterium]
MSLPQFFLGGGITALDLAILGGATLLVSFLVAAAGPTGGMQLAATAAVVPGPAVIPIHAWTTGFSALFRALTLRAHIDWGYVGRFVPASAVGALLVVGAYSRIQIPELQVIVAVYILSTSIYELTGKGLRVRFARPYPWWEGLLTGFASVIIGATGPLLMVLMQDHVPDRLRLSGTFSTCLAFQHLFKIVAFGLIGISVFSYFGAILVVTVAAAVGTLAGSRMLLKVDEKRYRKVLAGMLCLTSAWILLDSLILVTRR